MAAPVASPRGAWVCLFGLTLMLVFCMAAALPYPPATQPSGIQPDTGSRVGLRWVVVGGIVGLAWACALRGFMAEVAGAASGVDWVGTFVFILLPGLVVGGLLGWAAHLRRMGDSRYRRRLAFSPLLFSAVLFSDPRDPLAILEDGVGGGAIAVPLIAILGGYAVCGREQTEVEHGRPQPVRRAEREPRAAHRRGRQGPDRHGPVSYTHLTLPTICSV